MASVRLASVAALLVVPFAGCLAFDDECPDGIWGSSEVAGTRERTEDGTYRLTGVMLCGHKFSVHQDTGTLRLEAIDEDARGPLKWVDLRFEVGVAGIKFQTFNAWSGAMKPDTKERPHLNVETPLKPGDEIRFCRGPETPDPHVHVELTQVRYRAWLFDDDGVTASFERMPTCR